MSTALPSFTVDREAILRRIRSLIAIPSITGDANEEYRAAEHVAEWMRECEADEVTVKSVPMAELQQDPSFPGIEVERDSATFAYGVIHGSEPGPSVMLLGHIDVVPVGDVNQWTYSPFAATEVDDTLYGRGSCDMKSGVCAAFSVFEYFARHRQFPGTLKLLAVSGEEDGGSGCLAAVRNGCDADVCYIPEPTVQQGGGEPTVVVAHGGSVTLSIKALGKCAHASSREHGVNVIDHLNPVLEGLRESEREINMKETNPIMRAIGDIPYATSVGKIQGGEWASTVMDELTMEVRCGVALGETVASAITRIRNTVLERCKSDPWLVEHPPSLSSIGGEFAGSHIDPEHTIVRVLREAHKEVYGKEVVARATPYGCDMRILMHELGTSTCLYGPGSISEAHSTDEFVSIADVLRVTKVLHEAVVRVLFSGESFERQAKPQS